MDSFFCFCIELRKPESSLAEKNKKGKSNMIMMANLLRTEHANHLLHMDPCKQEEQKNYSHTLY